MYFNNKAIIGKNENQFLNLELNMLNRHGIITGATGTGKTISLKVIAESLSQAKIPCILTDIKGDLSGCSKEGSSNENLEKRISSLGLENFNFKKFPVRFWDVFGEKGHPIRVTISDMGPTLLSQIFSLSEAQEGILNIVFKIADDQGLELIDLKDLKAILKYVADHTNEYEMEYGNISSTSVSTILRKLLSIENDNGSMFFGEPNLDINDFMRCSEESGNGYLNIIEANDLVKNPTLYATFLVLLLSSFYEKLPEVGDLDKPKAVLFLDEAHLIFSEMNKEVIKKITQIIKLIRSKGIGVFFISQSPADIPNEILNQLGNRVQHCLRAYTPSELKAVKVAADSFRENDNFDTEESILELKTGEALISFIDTEGQPSIVQRATILPPQSYMGEISNDEMRQIISNGSMEIKYRQVIDRNSAHEKIQEKEKIEEQQEIKEKENKEKNKNKEKESELSKSIKKMTNSAMSSIGRQIGNAIMRGILGTKK